jgi:hypothetical protein
MRLRHAEGDFAVITLFPITLVLKKNDIPAKPWTLNNVIWRIPIAALDEDPK